MSADIPPLLLPSSLDAPAMARLHLHRHVAHLPASTFDDALVLTSELVTNAVQHGQPEIILSIKFNPLGITVTVSDTCPRLPPATPVTPPPSSAHGRGLLIINSLATSWGISAGPDQAGKSIWFHLAAQPR